MVMRIQQQLAHALALGTVFEHPTVMLLSEYMKNIDWVAHEAAADIRETGEDRELLTL
jgi:hypothetical protein